MSAVPAIRRDAAAAVGLDRARLPEFYTAAKVALRQCVKLDEIKEVGDKHEAIAHYAMRAKDESLMNYAKRIQLRAFERLGELLKEIENDDERMSTAKRFGISAVIARRAFEAAHIPTRVRDDMIDNFPMPSRKRMAEVGEGYVPRKPSAYHPRFRKHVDNEESVKPPPQKRAQEIVEYLRMIVSDFDIMSTDGVGGRYTMTQLGGAVETEDAASARQLLQTIFRSLESFRQALPRV